MSGSPSPSVQHQISSLPSPSPNPNPNPNFDTAEDDPSNKSQPSTPEIQNPPPKSPIDKTQNNNPNHQTKAVEQTSRVLVYAEEEPDPEQEQEQEQQKPQDCGELEQADQEEEEIEDEEGINMPHSSLSQSPAAKNSKVFASTVRRNKKRKKGFNTIHVAKQRKIIDSLSKGFNPIPFIPGKRFDFSEHEENLRKVGLWDFAHVQFDNNVRGDLLVQLIAHYTPKSRGSYVNDCRLKVSRPDLGRALKLPSKKRAGDYEPEVFSDEFIAFLEEFVSCWMLLHEGDVWVTPIEIVTWMKSIRDGQPQKVDWAGLIWFMVEKELAQGPELKDCYYASHLQQLIKDQKEILLKPSVDLGLEYKKVVEVMLEDDEDGGDREMLDVQDQCTELVGGKKPDDGVMQKDGDVDVVRRTDANLAEIVGDASELREEADEIDKEKNGSHAVSMEGVCEGEEMENIDDVECSKNVENSKGMSVGDMGGFGSERNWLDGVNDEGLHFMQPCSNMSGLKMPAEGARCDAGSKDVDDVVEDDEHEFNFTGKSTPIDEISSRNLLQAFETGHLSYNSVELGGHSSLGLVPATAENDVMLNGSSLFNHVVKREMVHENDISHNALDECQKQMRFDGHWDHKPSDSRTCIDEILQWAQKAKIAQDAEREEAYRHENMVQMCHDEIRTKNNEIMQWKCKYDDLQRKFHAEVSRQDRELHLMSNVIDGFRRALKDTQMAFADYRKRSQIRDEPIYKDVGNGGVVKSTMELERERVMQAEESEKMLNMVMHGINELDDDSKSQMQRYNGRLMSFDARLKNAAEEAQLLKRYFSKRKMSKTAAMSEEVQSEAQELEKNDLMEDKISECVAMSEEDQNEALEVENDEHEPKTSEDVSMLEEGQGDAKDLLEDDPVEPRMSDTDAMLMPEELPSEAQDA